MYDDLEDGAEYEVFEWGRDARVCAIKYEQKHDRFVRYVPAHWEVIRLSEGQSETWKAEKERFSVKE